MSSKQEQDDERKHDNEEEQEQQDDEQKERSLSMIVSELSCSLSLLQSHDENKNKKNKKKKNNNNNNDEARLALKLAETRAAMMELVEKHSMAPFYKKLCALHGWKIDSKLVSKMEQQNAAELAKIDEKLEDAKENLGDIEVKNALLERAEFFARIGEKDEALKAYDATLERTAGAGSRIDLVFASIRLGFMHDDLEVVRTNVERAKTLVNNGGDWERRNLLKVYEATYLMTVRDLEGAAKLFLDGVATFTCYEMYDYAQFAFYTVLLGLLTLDRPTVRDSIVHAPDILAVVNEVPHLKPLMMSLYNCKYADFFQALTDISEQIKYDRFLSAHFGYYVREIRIVAYRQFLQSYLSVKLQSMAEQFGVPMDFLDKELSRFISTGRLNCKIDKVHGVVETVRPDQRNSQYQDVIKHGDQLLGRIQKLTKTVAL